MTALDRERAREPGSFASSAPVLLLRPRGAGGNDLVQLCWCLSRPWGVHSHLLLLRSLPLLLLRSLPLLLVLFRPGGVQDLLLHLPSSPSLC